MALEVDEAHARIRIDVSRDYLWRIIGAGVADNNQLPIRERLSKNALDGISQRATAIVGCDHYRNRRTSHCHTITGVLDSDTFPGCRYQ
jgi:hypothetical protein